MNRNDPNDAIWFTRAEQLIAGLNGVMDWAHKMHATDYGDIDAFRIATLPGITEIIGRRRLALAASATDRSVDLAAIPTELLTPLETYLAETPGFDPTVQIEHQRDTAFEMHSYVQMAMRSLVATGAGLEQSK